MDSYKQSSVKTPMQQFIEHAEGASKWLQGPAKEAVDKAVLRAKQLLPIEKSHICEAFREGAEGVKHQTGQSYYRATYGDLKSE